MDDQKAHEDELARRRALREQARSRTPVPDESDPDQIKFTWKDILAMTIAAYQVLFPMLLAMVGALVLAYLFFRLYFW